MATNSQVQLAALLVPILGLLVVSAVDSVDSNDKAWNGWYPVFVLSVSVATIGPLAVASLLAVLSLGIEVSTTTVLIHAGAAVVMSFILVTGVTFRETTRDMDRETGYRHLIGLAIVGMFYTALNWIAP